MGTRGRRPGPKAHSTGLILLQGQTSCPSPLATILKQPSAKGQLPFPLCISASLCPLLIRTHPTNSLFDLCHMLPNKVTFKATGVRTPTHLPGNTSSDRHPLPSQCSLAAMPGSASSCASQETTAEAEPLMSLHRLSHFLSSPCLLFLLPFIP